MKKASAEGFEDDLRPEYDLARLKGGVRAKYYRQAIAGTNLVLIERELAEVFPDTESVNRALRLLVSVRHAIASLSSNTAEQAAGPSRRRTGASNKLLKPSAAKRIRSSARR